MATTATTARPLPKPAPKMPPRVKQPSAQVRSRPLVALGAVLVVGLTILAFAGGRVFGPGREPDTTATQEAAFAPFPTPRDDAGAILPAPIATPLATPVDDGGPVVCLDPGHGGEDFGFTRDPLDPLNLDEKVLVLQHAWDLEARLKDRGYTVAMTRRTDTEGNREERDINNDGKTAQDDEPGSRYFRNLDELQARIDVCNAARADLLVSLHVNGFSTSVPLGYETWYTPGRPFSDRSEAFARLAYVELKEQLRGIGYELPVGVEERGVKPDTAVNVDDNKRQQLENFIMTGPAIPGAVPRASEMPGAIVEALFLSNDQDAYVLASAGGRWAIVTAYENAVIDYFEEFPPGPSA